MRTGTVNRKTKETDIKVDFCIDGKGASTINTGIGFFDHMLTGFAKHGFFDMELSCSGDLEVDGHHTVEDCGIALGQAIKEAAGDKKGIKRFGNFILPMDDALVMCAIDFSGRPYLNYDAKVDEEKCGDYETCLTEEFFYALSYSAGINIHIIKMAGNNGHHIIEAIFKAFGKALDQALSMDERVEGVLSTKGAL
ncbi:MAG: imidazoleglycerol-phosphate dehydratase HisB [Lachnospiraceae bacterium]|nr:imidazoleglycerol-phosphate dehydratase HisB [Lachnospiraceae bacterium]